MSDNETAMEYQQKYLLNKSKLYRDKLWLLLYTWFMKQIKSLLHQYKLSLEAEEISDIANDSIIDLFTKYLDIEPSKPIKNYSGFVWQKSKNMLRARRMQLDKIPDEFKYPESLEELIEDHLL